jgi:hypothetical protein
MRLVLFILLIISFQNLNCQMNLSDTFLTKEKIPRSNYTNDSISVNSINYNASIDEFYYDSIQNTYRP